MSERWLKCFIMKGMFSDERAIRLVSKSDSPLSFFVPKSMVRGALDKEGEVKVLVFKREGDTLAILPTDNRSVVPILEENLVSA